MSAPHHLPATDSRSLFQPTVSVVLPNYNYAHYFSARADEILHQTYPVSQLIILDDASTDNSVSVIKQKIAAIRNDFPRIQIVTQFSQRNSGNVFTQWLKGIQLATSDYLWIAELDDSARSTFLATAMQPCLAHPDIVLSYTNSAFINSAGRPVASAYLRQKLDIFRRRHTPGNYIVNGITELNRHLAVFNSIPNVSAAIIKNGTHLPQLLAQASQYHLAGDWYLYTQLALHGKIAYNSQKLNLHRLHDDSVTSSTDLRQRFAEIQQIHAQLLQTGLLQSSTIRRIQHNESALAKHWHLH